MAKGMWDPKLVWPLYNYTTSPFFKYTLQLFNAKDPAGKNAYNNHIFLIFSL